MGSEYEKIYKSTVDLDDFYKRQELYKQIDDIVTGCQIGDKYKDIPFKISIFISCGCYHIFDDDKNSFLTFCSKRCKTMEELINYMQKNYPEHIKNNDIKIALK